MRHHIRLLGLALAISLFLPMSVFALKAHDGECNGCHRMPGANPRGLANLCTTCHYTVETGLFANAKASDALGHNHINAPDSGSSHYWGGSSTVQLAAGATNPPTTFYKSTYSVSTKRVTCSICHDPHADRVTKPKLLRATAVDDVICKKCHTGFDIDNPNALKTHPIGSSLAVPPTPYAAIYDAAPTPKKFKLPATVPDNAAQGVTLINGYVSCTSCHAAHFADSYSLTLDGKATASGLLPGDGHLLKADGPTRADKSALCQTCHTYQRHGNPAINSKQAGRTALPQEDVGCLSCHSGHAYNGGVSNYYVLRNVMTTVTFGTKNNALYTPLTDLFLMNKKNGNGFCERCHGISSAIPMHSIASGGIEDRYLQNCKDCHKHNEPGTNFSWKWSENIAVCGDCHGFPPYLNVAGDYKDLDTVGTKGGYAVMDGVSDGSHSYATSGYDETLTPHKSHAAGGDDLGVYTEATDYKLGEGGAACDPCHNLATHKQIDNVTSFRNIVWGTISKGNVAPNSVGLVPAYTTTGNGSCATVYCHSNGGKRPAGVVDIAKVSTDFKFAPAAPAWATGDADIIGAISPNHECAYFCHGNSAISMNSSNRDNSVSHIKHLAKGYACNVCHKLTAAVGSITAVLNTARVAPAGKHVNGKPDVGFDTTNDFDPAQAGTQLNSVKPASGDNGSGYTATTAVCNVYCHSDGKAIRTYANADWDQASTGACGTCHQYYSGGVPTGSGAALSAPHAKHLAITLPTAVTCVDCHDAGALTGVHTGHVNGAFTFLQAACDGCHGWTSGEKVPVWGETPSVDQYCLTCHTGTTTGLVKTKTAPNKEAAKTRGHNATVNYTSGNLPGNKLCTSCHLSTFANHVDGTTGNATGLVAAAATCTTTCHGPSGSAVKDGIITHVSKACSACHDPHGDTTQTNIYMVRSKSTGNYTSDATPVVFTNRGNDALPLTALQSFDEDDGAAGNPGEVNADDFCATCHTAAALTNHNNRDNTPTTGSHHQGETCMTASCHKPHTEATGAFKGSAGTACNGCHDYPPNTGAHGNGTNKHTRVISPNRIGEDLSDCAKCHTGAELYTYDLGVDSAAGGSQANHGVGDVNQKAVLTASVGYNTTNFNCTTACHLSTVGDGAWTDVNGLNCTACHYYGTGITSSANNIAAVPKDLKGSHNAHFAKSKQCTSCHSVPSDTTHISIPTGTDLEKIQNRAAAVQDEATVTMTAASISGGNNCSGTTGISLGCHNTKTTPVWGAGSITCTNCHDTAGSATADPKTGLHNIGATESAAGVQKHDSTITGGCTACHNSTKPPSHTDGTYNNDTAVRTDRFLTVKVGMFVDNATANRGTCSGTGNLSTCHSDGGNWTRLWSTEANSTVTASASARCNVCHGQYSTLSGSAGLGWNVGTSHYKTYGNATSTRGVSHKSQAGENNACEDCHSYTTLTSNHDTVTHQVTMNDDVATVQVTEAASRVYCAYCHVTGDPLTSGTYTLTQSVFPIQRVAGANDPKQECNNCHGDGTGRYWPMAAYGGGNAANDGGRHEIHLTRLAKAKYNLTVTALLADVDVKNKQIELCKYCHNATVPGQNPGHNDSALPAEVAANMYALWDLTRTTPDAVTYTGTGANGTGTCANSNCHNGKNTNSVANFTWHGTGTQNCLLCHNDITVTTAGTTGATHAAHTGSAATFGKTIDCASCHGGTPSWSPYIVATTTAGNSHIDGLFKVGTAANAGIAFVYGGTYTDAATRTVGSCAINLCHNNGKNVATPAYTWQTAIAGCAACHATTAAALASSHDPHMNAAFTTTFRSTVLACTDCHDAVNATDMTGKTAHMDGTVTLVGGLTYSGTPNSLNVTLATYGTCSGSCHVDHLAAPKASPTWNRAPASGDNCTICHASAPADGRHAKHMLETDYVTGCGNCHTSANNTATTITSATHFDGTRNTAGTSTVVYTAANGTCTNSCHKVTDGRDWTSGGTSPVLACTDCHQAGTIAATKGALPTSGLHNMTATGVQKHDATLGTNGCKECHVTPAGTHLDNAFVADSGINNDRFVNRANMVWADGAANSGTCWDNGSTGLNYNAGAGCHRDDGYWKRLWSTDANLDSTANPNPGQLVCDVCHGQYQTLHVSSKGWREGSVHYRSGASAAENKGSSHNTGGGNANACEDCHAYDSSGGANHQNGALNFSGGAGVPGTYTLTMGTSGWYCAACHNSRSAEVATLTTSHTFPDSTAFAGQVYVVGVTQPVSGACGSCHDDNVIPPNSGAHVAHGADNDSDYSECEACHGTNNGGSWAPGSGGAHNDGFVTFAAGITYSNGGTPGTNAAAANDTCSTTQCHSKSTEVATWGTPASLGCDECHNATATVVANNAGRTLGGSHNAHFAKGKTCSACHGTLPINRTHISAGSGTDGAILTGRANAAPDEADVLGTIATQNDPGNETCSGAGVGLGCHNTKTTPAWNAGSITCTNCHDPAGSATADPKTGLHNIGATESAAGVQKHDSTLPGGGCTACHNSTKPATHTDGTFNNDTAVRTDRFLTVKAGMFVDNATANRGTCTGTGGLATCHSDGGNWTRLWSTEANSTATASGSARCNVCHGQYSTLSGSGGLGWNAGTTHYKTYGGATSTRGSSHKSLAGENNACEDCHSYTTLTTNHDTVTHQVTMNDDAATITVTEAASRAYCAACHATGDPLVSGTYAFTQSVFPIQRVAGANDARHACNDCHGDGTGRYWPMAAYGGGRPENDGGRHEIHLTRLAKAKYSMTVAQLLVDADVKNKQIELCQYCHNATVPGQNPGHTDTALPAEVATNMYALWDTTRTTPDAVTYTGTGANGTGTCALALCHNNKNTNSVANFTWHGTGTQNCLLCHNDITSTTPTTTGATHQAHVGAVEAVYGKTITCASCHGGSVTWSPYVVPTNDLHINGAFNVGTSGGGSVSFNYLGTYTDAATRVVGSCGINLCHNNGKNVAAPAYIWQTTTFAGCAACHATTAAALASSHDPHMNAAFTTTFRSTVLACTDCHDAVNATDMTNKTAHMDGTINWKTGATFTYTGNASVATPNSYGTCSGACHVNELAAPTASPAWNRTPASGDNCTICHASAPADGRHAKHMLVNAAYLTTGCGNCHSNANATATAITSATHFNGTRNTGGTSTVVYNTGDNTCTNSCHKVYDTRDWTSGGTSPVLACIDCHQAGTIAATKAALPTSGLHNMTATGVQKHDATLGTNGCKECHVTPAGTHLNGTFVVDSGANNDRFLNTRSGLVWADGATNSGTCFDNGASGAGSLDLAVAGCHRDNGVWKRLWSTAANVDTQSSKNPGQLVCDVCHGQYQTLNGSSQGWREGSVHYRSGAAGVAENKGVSHNRTSGAPVANACDDCHAYPSAIGVHENGALNFSGGAGVPGTYTLTTGTSGWYCATCHNAHSAESATTTDTHTFPDSTAFATRTYVVGLTQPEGGCTGCHGNLGTGGNWPDGSTGHAANQDGEHTVHVYEIARFIKLPLTTAPTIAEQNATCNYCHPGNGHGNTHGGAYAVVSHTDTANDGTPDLELGTTMKKIIGGGADSNGFWRRTPGTCSNVACHAGAPFTPHWYVDTVAPAAIANLAATDNALRTSPEPGTIELTWTAPGDDDNLDGTAYRYDVRFSTSTITSVNFDTASQANVPTVDRMGKAQKVVIRGLTPATTYYYAVKTADERYPNAAAWSTISNVVSRAAQADNVAPVFWGISAVSSGDESLDLTPNPDTNSVYVSWEAARDHSHSLTTPINYLVLWSEYALRTHFTNGINGGPMPSAIGTDACFDKSKTGALLVQVTCGSVAPTTNEYRIKSAQTTALGYNVIGLPVGMTYNFLVRAKDNAGTGNIDTNRADMMAMGRTTPYKTIALQTDLTSATIPAVSAGWTTPVPFSATSVSDGALGAVYPGTAPGTFSMAANAVIAWSPDGSAAAGYTVKTNVWGLSYQIKITGSSTAATTMTYQFGYLTAKAFTGLGTYKTLVVSKTRVARVFKFPLSTFKGTIPAGSKPAFILKNGANSVTLAYGSIANKGGILLYNEQDYNDLPTGLGSLAQSTVTSSTVGGNVYRLTWTAANPVNAGQTVHYDVFGSIDNGGTWPYVIARNLANNTVDWDPVGDGITGNLTNVVKFRVMAGDGYRSGNMVTDGSNANNANHSVMDSAAFSVNNSVDIWTPAAIGSAAGTEDDLKAETRPKQGSVYLTWKAVGNDGFNHGTRATQYDIRYNTVSINDANWAVSTQANNEPYPDFTGSYEGYEVLGLTPDVPYYFTMKVGDAIGNWSALSNVASVNSGPKCGICHSTPPDETSTAGNHGKHGFTMSDCAVCHGTEAATFTTDHQDGALKLRFKSGTAYVGNIAANRLFYTVDGTPGGTVIYDDTTGGGGFVDNGTDHLDNGTCFNFNAANASGCHGAATPVWNAASTLACSACHGLSTRTTDSYGRNFDATIDNAMVVPDEVKAAPGVDNRGNASGKYVGAHLKHLNSSFRLAKGDNCKLCHNNPIHANGNPDVSYDLNVVGATALWTDNATGAGTPGTCGGTSVVNCHGANVPTWDSAATVACNECHGFAGKTFPIGSAPTINGGAGVIAHVADVNVVRACTWCHPAGHPQGTVQDPNSIMIPNNPLVGIAYRSGGIHLLKTINGRTATTEAQGCWTCHDAQGTKITEWAANNDALTGATPYNYGNLFTSFASPTFSGATSNWLGSGTGAYWQSGTSVFQTIKAGKIQSTHSTNPGGTGTVTYDATNKRYNETLDAVADLRCSNCHDVHNMNKAPDDTAIGTPYLRGTWMGNPYQEDGPPLSTTTYAGVAIGSYNFGAIPRGGTGYRRLGGYFIDQNNVVPGTATATTMAALDDYPTAGWTQESSAGLCILCHGNDVDNMDQKTGETLWLGTNGHSNSAIGGTFTNSANIFVNLTGGLTGLPTAVSTTTYVAGTQVPDMAYQMQPGSPSTTRGYGYRGMTGGAGYAPKIATDYAHYAYNWGATVDSGTTDQMYHQFSCSKCHNPHASRLPKLLITNCLDVQHNTWTTSMTAQSSYTAATLTDVDKGWTAAYYASAQNCHRYNNKRTAVNKGGWNKVTPWTTANQ